MTKVHIDYYMAYPKPGKKKAAPKKAGPVKPPLGTAHKAKAASVAPKKKARKNIVPNAHPWDEYGP